MDIYKISLKNKELISKLPSNTFYFQDQETAMGVIKLINSMVKEGITLEWEFEIVKVLNKEETIQQLLIVDGLFNTN